MNCQTTVSWALEVFCLMRTRNYALPFPQGVYAFGGRSSSFRFFVLVLRASATTWPHGFPVGRTSRRRGFNKARLSLYRQRDLIQRLEVSRKRKSNSHCLFIVNVRYTVFAIPKRPFPSIPLLNVCPRRVIHGHSSIATSSSVLPDRSLRLATACDNAHLASP